MLKTPKKIHPEYCPFYGGYSGCISLIFKGLFKYTYFRLLTHKQAKTSTKMQHINLVKRNTNDKNFQSFQERHYRST